MLSAQILMNRSWLGINTKFILRSMGEDIQYDAASNYGHDECSAERQLISEAYLMADYCWSLSQEITDLYLDLGIVRAKIYQIGNVVRRPASVPKRAKAKKMRIGVIGRQHAKKNFDLLAQIQPLLTSQAYELHVKIAGSSPEVVCSPDTHYHDASSVTHLRYWPPDDVWEFYAQIDILLILSRVESFGNVTFEAGLAGAHLVMHEDLTGAAIARHLGFAVTTFNDYSATRIVDAIKSIPSQTIPESEPRSAINADEISNMICEVTRE